MAEIIQKKKYSDLPQITTLKDNDMVMISDGTTSKVITSDNLKTEITKDIQVDTTNLATKTELTTGLSAKSDIGHNHDSAYATKSSEHTHSNKVELDKIQTGDKAKWDAKVDVSAIPTKTSQLTNDSSFVNQTQVDTSVSTAISNSITSGGIKTELDKKADKSTTYTKTEVNTLIDAVSAGEVDLTNYYNKTETDNKLNNKVDKVAGKSLIADTEIARLSTLQNADVTKSYVDGELVKKSNIGHNHVIGDIANFPILSNVATSGSYNDLTNKPTIPTVTNDLTATLKTNYDAAYTHSQQAHAPSNAEANVQSDWNVIDISSDSYIKNKPNIPDVSDFYTKAQTDQKITDAVTGGTVDLSNYYTKQEAYGKTEVDTRINLKVDKVDGKTLTTNDLTNTLKSNYDSAYTHSQSTHFSGSYVDLTNKPTTFTPSSHSHVIGDLPTGTTATTVALGSHNHSGLYEPVITKNTAFNVNFETVATNVKMNGTQSIGSLNTIARADHVHPNDTTKVDKVAGKSLILDTEITRLASIINYTHPSTHAASVIAQDAGNRFVSDAQISAWDAKEPAITKNTAFNKNFGTAAGTISEGNHTHPSDTTKVDKVVGKSLISDTEITRLASVTNYTLPTASATVLGGVKIGSGLVITNGVVSTTGGGVADSVDWNNVQNKPVTFTPGTHSHSIADLPIGTSETTVALGNHNHNTIYEPVITTKNTAFNQNFETTATNIKMDGTQSLGALSTVARADHVHPSDTTKVNTSTTINGTALSSNITLTLDNINDGTTRKLANYVPTTTTVNSKTLSSNVTLTLDDVGNGSTRSLANYSLTTHNHDTSYVAIPTVTTITIATNTCAMTTAPVQYVAMVTGTTINLPTVSTFTEIRLIFSCSADLTLTFPNIKWQNEPEAKNGKTYEYCFTWVNATIGWIGGWISYA